MKDVINYLLLFSILCFSVVYLFSLYSVCNKLYQDHLLPEAFIINQYVSTENILNSKFFFEHQVTDKGQKDCNLIQIANSKYKTAIFGMVLNYNYSLLCYFFDSLSCSSFDGTLILLYCNIDQITLNYIIKYSFQFEIILIPIKISIPYIEKNHDIVYYKNNEIIKKTSTSDIKPVDYIRIRYVSGDYRFDIAYSLYVNHFFDAYDMLFLTDIRDVIFQQDFRKYNFTEGVYICEEARISLKKTSFWIRIFKNPLNLTDDMSDLCVGTLFLVGKKSFSFLADLHDQLKRQVKYVRSRANFQGTMKYMIYNKTYNYPAGYIKYITNEHGIVNTMGIYTILLRDFKKKYKKMNYFNIYDINYHDNLYQLYNMDFKKYALIHHTPYFPDTFDKTYPGIMKICKANRRKIYDQIEYIHKSFF